MNNLLRTYEVIAGEVEVVQLGVVEEVEDHLFGQDYVVADHADVQIGNMLPQLTSRKERLFGVLIFIFSVFAKYQEHLNCVVDRPVVGHAEPGELRVVSKQGLIPGEHLE